MKLAQRLLFLFSTMLIILLLILIVEGLTAGSRCAVTLEQIASFTNFCP